MTRRIQIGSENRPMTAAEIAAAEAREAALAPLRARISLREQAATTLAGYAYQGVNFPLTSEKLAYYEGVNRNAQLGVLDGLYPVQLVGDDGIVEAADAAAIAAAYADMLAAFMSVTTQLGAQLKALES